MDSEHLYELTAAIVAASVVLGGIVITVLGLWVKGSLIDLPGWLQTSIGAVIGFYFGRGMRLNGQTKRYVEPVPYIEESKHGV